MIDESFETRSQTLIGGAGRLAGRRDNAIAKSSKRSQPRLSATREIDRNEAKARKSGQPLSMIRETVSASSVNGPENEPRRE